MAISRAQMGKQLKGNKMKKPVKKKVLGGLMDDGMVPLGIIPQLIAKRNKKNKAAPNASDPSEAMIRAASQPKAMKKGGKVGGRGDGCCQRGKTKGRMV